MHKYKVGQKVKILDHPRIIPRFKKYVGAVASITVCLNDDWHGSPFYQVDIYEGERPCNIAELILQPIDDGCVKFLSKLAQRQKDVDKLKEVVHG